MKAGRKAAQKSGSLRDRVVMYVFKCAKNYSTVPSRTVIGCGSKRAFPRVSEHQSEQVCKVEHLFHFYVLDHLLFILLSRISTWRSPQQPPTNVPELPQCQLLQLHYLYPFFHTLYHTNFQHQRLLVYNESSSNLGLATKTFLLPSCHVSLQ